MIGAHSGFVSEPLLDSGSLQPRVQILKGVLEPLILVWNFVCVDILYTRESVTGHITIEILQVVPPNYARDEHRHLPDRHD